MIVSPRTPNEWNTMCSFLKFHAGVEPSPDMVFMGWTEGNHLKVVVAMHAFIGKVCQIHVAFAKDWSFSPREMLKQVFQYAFITRERDLLLGVVNSKNEKAMKFDMHLGFSELHRIPGAHDDGGDLVLMGMYRKDCRYLKADPELKGENVVQFQAGNA